MKQNLCAVFNARLVNAIKTFTYDSKQDEDAKKRSLLQIELYCPTHMDDVPNASGYRPYVAVNKRPIHCTEIEKLLKKCFRLNLNKSDLFSLVHITVPKELVDINVEPNKRSVLFADEQRIMRQIELLLGEALAKPDKISKEAIAAQQPVVPPTKKTPSTFVISKGAPMSSPSDRIPELQIRDMSSPITSPHHASDKVKPEPKQEEDILSSDPLQSSSSAPSTPKKPSLKAPPLPSPLGKTLLTPPKSASLASPSSIKKSSPSPAPLYQVPSIQRDTPMTPLQKFTQHYVQKKKPITNVDDAEDDDDDVDMLEKATSKQSTLLQYIRNQGNTTSLGKRAREIVDVSDDSSPQPPAKKQRTDALQLPTILNVDSQEPVEKETEDEYLPDDISTKTILQQFKDKQAHQQEGHYLLQDSFAQAMDKEVFASQQQQQQPARAVHGTTNQQIKCKDVSEMKYFAHIQDTDDHTMMRQVLTRLPNQTILFFDMLSCEEALMLVNLKHNNKFNTSLMQLADPIDLRKVPELTPLLLEHLTCKQYANIIEWNGFRIEQHTVPNSQDKDSQTAAPLEPTIHLTYVISSSLIRGYGVEDLVELAQRIEDFDKGRLPMLLKHVSTISSTISEELHQKIIDSSIGFLRPKRIMEYCRIYAKKMVSLVIQQRKEQRHSTIDEWTKQVFNKMLKSANPFQQLVQSLQPSTSASPLTEKNAADQDFSRFFALICAFS